MFIRFVVGGDGDHHRSLTGIITEARIRRDNGDLDEHQSARLEDAYAWLNEHLPVRIRQGPTVLFLTCPPAVLVVVCLAQDSSRSGQMPCGALQKQANQFTLPSYSGLRINPLYMRACCIRTDCSFVRILLDALPLREGDGQPDFCRR